MEAVVTFITMAFMSLAMPKKKQTLVVSGEAGKLAKVIVWNTGVLGKAPEVLKVLKGFHQVRTSVCVFVCVSVRVRVCARAHALVPSSVGVSVNVIKSAATG